MRKHEKVDEGFQSVYVKASSLAKECVTEEE